MQSMGTVHVSCSLCTRSDAVRTLIETNIRPNMRGVTEWISDEYRLVCRALIPGVGEVVKRAARRRHIVYTPEVDSLLKQNAASLATIVRKGTKPKVPAIARASFLDATQRRLVWGRVAST